MELTAEQQSAYDRLSTIWTTVGDPLRMIGACGNALGESCIMVEVTGESGCSVWLGIETDGYTHS